MIKQKLNDPQWRRKNRIWAFVSGIPVFGWMGFLIMGQRSGYKPFRRAGAIYGWLSMIALALVACGEELIPGLIYSQRGTFTRTAFLMQDMGFYAVILLVILWPACFAHTLARSNRYLQYLALTQVNQPAQHPMVQDKAWRRGNLGWMTWAWLPCMGGLAVYYAGSKLKNRKLRIGATLTVLVSVVLVVVSMIGSRLSQYYMVGNGIYAVANWYMAGQWLICLLLSFHLRDRVLDAKAVQWEADVHLFPRLGDRKWRNANSGWRIWTWLPIVGGIGIALAGLQSKKIQVTAKGVLFCVCSGLLFAVRICWNVVIAGIRDLLSPPTVSAIRFGGENIIAFLSVFVYLLILFYGTLILWDTLRARAASLQGYSSEFDREVDMQTRMRARKIEFTSAPVQPEVKPEARMEIPKAPEARPEQPVHMAAATTVATSEAAPNTPVDINHATQAELMTLPGIGVVQAKQALEYRAANGGFKSVDEFVEVLRIKPHFAVQIFQRATLGQEKTADPKPTAEGSTVRRRIDF